MSLRRRASLSGFDITSNDLMKPGMCNHLLGKMLYNLQQNFIKDILIKPKQVYHMQYFTNKNIIVFLSLAKKIQENKPFINNDAPNDGKHKAQVA